MLLSALGIGGVESLMYEYIKKIQTEDIQIDILAGRLLAENAAIRFEKQNVKVFCLDSAGRGIKKYRKLYAVFRNRKYDIVHLFAIASFQCWILYLAKCCGVRIRIAHSVNVKKKPAKFYVRILHRLFRPLMRVAATDYFACGAESAASLFGTRKKFQNTVRIYKNGFDLSLFQFSRSERILQRERLGITEQTLLIGNIGRLAMQKNQAFLLEVFYEIRKMKKNARLLIVGSGALEKRLKERAVSLNICSNVIFHGASDDISGLMNAMDILVMPSLFEGVSIVMVEAQAMGLFCITSDRVPKETDVTGAVEFLSLKESAKKWAEHICTSAENFERKNLAGKVRKAGYSIDEITDDLKKYYIQRQYSQKRQGEDRA